MLEAVQPNAYGHCEPIRLKWHRQTEQETGHVPRGFIGLMPLVSLIVFAC
jgi:hypothetical protein